MSMIHVFKSYLFFLHFQACIFLQVSSPKTFLLPGLFKAYISFQPTPRTDRRALLTLYWSTVDFTFKRFPSLWQRFVPLRYSLTCQSLAQLRGLKDILKPHCCKEFPCTAAPLCPLIEIPLFSGAVSAAGEWDPVQGMSSRGAGNTIIL